MKASENLNITLNGEKPAELIIREGKAPELFNPEKIEIKGILDTPLRWLKRRIETINPLCANILVDREKMVIQLTVNEKDHFNEIYLGHLEMHPDFEKFDINTGKYINNFTMADLFKMNRSSFQNRDEAMRLVSELQGFKAKVEKEIEKMNDNRGNARLLLSQTVESNLPKSFNLNVPIFKGYEKQIIEVEVYVRAEDFACTLISPAANDFVSYLKDEKMDEVLKEIAALFPAIVIIEV
jgi:hypothetical protein